MQTTNDEHFTDIVSSMQAFETKKKWKDEKRKTHMHHSLLLKSIRMHNAHTMEWTTSEKRNNECNRQTSI